ncbi:bifunctional alpha,alpha-trehalose-phosphate synthase (UDP-forming)/trehalose-phosphatase [Mucilaginibacter pallidiroseus]|uniref:Bifunctional alpha,alpha-trehalose-phosphate synthase (UDP-forming)/trehalose-phosphatase n=1 Tax=Mucilaginibacter pallidiroseus TaxID=2599295 RepID=A0A563U876_9SPHI|nr:bifunctional alpha,alpha-trehalose-phosphate synthase (UDP-forming)/trehalose-phosphatase [Mucilaginibacter pallidiroseus]TWR27557.1 bifunctional alpha,alpha-trehalose-phosphate synthase (UDP-forming)/trehalose-phosphatase [Mucilaginibacter pallidiroseus]
MSKLFIISNRLPITIEKKGDKLSYRQSSGGLVSAVSAYLDQEGQRTFTKKVWVGVSECSEQEWQTVSDTFTADYDFHPIFAAQKTYDQYYNGFANSVLWPLFHYFPSYADYQPQFFEAYKKINHNFADDLANQLNPEDTVWIHDYHLLPLAALLCKRNPKLTIGLFLHIPFPSYELFRAMPNDWQHEIIEGMLGADLVGFHTNDYRDHFLNCVSKITQAKVQDQIIHLNGRQIKTGAFPIGIDYDQFNSAYNNEGVVAKRNEHLHMKQDKKLIFSVDRLDYTKGVFSRLKGYREFLLQNPGYIGKVIFALVVIPSRDNISRYAERKKIIDEYVGNLNSRFGNIGWQPVVYQYGHLSFDELIALYTACDIALITPLRDGMNLVAKEFVASRKDKRGVLVLSEMAGAADELPEALIINPNDRKEIGDMIRRGLEMPRAEQEDRMAAMQARISSYNVVDWARDFFNRLKDAKAGQLQLRENIMDNFDKAKILDRYSSATDRLILLDYDGTLAPFAKEPGMARPSDEVLQILTKLSADNHNKVYIVSGRDSDTLQGWLGHLPIGIIAEHGAKVKHMGQAWGSFGSDQVKDKLQTVYKMMQGYVDACPGSFIEEKDFSLAWHYRKADPVTGPLKAARLLQDLQKSADTRVLSLLDGHKVIEVKGGNTDKGQAIEQLMTGHTYDFILCIGDDQTDEDMFRKLAGVANAFTIKVGAEESLAAYNLLTPYLVHALLQTLSQRMQPA